MGWLTYSWFSQLSSLWEARKLKRRHSSKEGAEVLTSWLIGTRAHLKHSRLSNLPLQWNTSSKKAKTISTKPHLLTMSLLVSLWGPITIKLPQWAYLWHAWFFVQLPTSNIGRPYGNTAFSYLRNPYTFFYGHLCWIVYVNLIQA